jgi:hypothetical protein
MLLPLQSLAGLVLAASTAAPELYFEQTTQTGPVGAPAGPGVVSQVWYAGKKIRLEAGAGSGGNAFILRLDKETAWRLDPEAKTATEIDLDRLRARSQMDVSMAGDLMGSEEATPRSAALRTRRTIAGYPCRGYRISAGPTLMDVWVTDALPIGIEAFSDFLEWTGASDAMGGILEEVRKLRGFPLETRTRTTVLGKTHETLSTVTKVKVGPQPRDLFEPPAGYRVVREAPEPEP